MGRFSKIGKVALVGIFVIAGAESAFARFGEFKVFGAQVNLGNPVAPVQPPPIQMGPVTVTPPAPSPIPAPPAIHVGGNGEVEKGINTFSQIEQAPAQAGSGALTASKAGIDHALDEAKKFFNDPLGFKKLASEKSDKALTWLEQLLSNAVFWLVAGLVGVIGLSVLLGSVFTSLIIGRRAVQRS